jgi:hypothetical protein
MKRLVTIAAFCIAVAVDAAPITPGSPLPVRILYDNSGSMYPGYRPPGSPDRHSRDQLGVHFFYQAPGFAQWLDDFVRGQAAMGGDTAGMWTFTSNGAFTPADIHEVHPVVPLRDFRTETALANFPPHPGNNTYLTETLNAFTRDFTGLVWLITDNIVEERAGEPDAGVQEFFETLARSNDLRSVHLFKHTFEENGQSSALAVYGILVSAQEIPPETLAHYDRKFRDLFPGHEHLKLKNLSIEPLTLHADLQLVLADRDKGMFKEGQSVQLDLDGEIQSHLTQHAVTAGHYELAIASPFAAEPWAQRDLGAQPLAPDLFDSASGEIAEEIPPNGSRRVHAQLGSNQPVSFTPSGIGEWLRLAWSGATVRYTGNVRMSLADVKVHLKQQRMAGIFGIDHATSVFAFQDVTVLHGIQPSVVPVSFALRTGSSRTAILLLILSILAVIVATAAFMASRTQTFRIVVANTAPSIVALRRLGTHNIIDDRNLLGRLSRGLVNGYDFIPATGNPAFTVVPSGDGETWDVKFIGGPSRRLSIKAEGGGNLKKPAAAAPAARGAPPPPPPLPRTGASTGRPPKIGR